VLTGRGDDETYAKARSLGVAGYFTKPVESDKLIKAIEAQIALRKARPREELS